MFVDTPAVHAVILAAGESGRFGKPKQLVEFDGEILIKRVAHQAAGVCGNSVSVVLGAHQELIAPQLRDLSVNIVTATDWQDGLSASLRAGIKNLPSGCAAALVMLGDRPRITGNALKKLISAWQANPDAIVASAYNGVIGVPAVFPARVFTDLVSLKGDTGAKSLIASDANVTAVSMPEAAFDINTKADLLRAR